MHNYNNIDYEPSRASFITPLPRHCLSPRKLPKSRRYYDHDCPPSHTQRNEHLLILLLLWLKHILGHKYINIILYCNHSFFTDSLFPSITLFLLNTKRVIDRQYFTSYFLCLEGRSKDPCVSFSFFIWFFSTWTWMST